MQKITNKNLHKVQIGTKLYDTSLARVCEVIDIRDGFYKVGFPQSMWSGSISMLETPESIKRDFLLTEEKGVWYVVKSTSVGTDENPNFRGETRIYYHGRDDKFLHDLSPYYVVQGYSRLADAKRNWSYNNPQNDKFWRTTVEIIAVEV